MAIDLVVCLNCHVKTNPAFPHCGHCGKDWSVKEASKQAMLAVQRRPAFRYGEQLVH